MSEKNWFGVRLRFRCEVGGRKSDAPLFEDSIRVVLATTEFDARVRADALGPREEHSYLNEAGEEVRWIFARVVEVQDLCISTLSDGAEVFSILRRRADEEE